MYRKRFKCLWPLARWPDTKICYQKSPYHLTCWDSREAYHLSIREKTSNQRIGICICAFEKAAQECDLFLEIRQKSDQSDLKILTFLYS